VPHPFAFARAPPTATYRIADETNKFTPLHVRAHKK